MDKQIIPKASNRQIGKAHENQKGFGLVEILVAMAIGLLLMAGIIQIFTGSRQTYRVQENLSHLQENGRFALIQLGNILRMTGFMTDPTDILTFKKYGATTGTEAIAGTDTAGSPDQISVSFQGAPAPDETTIDCLGNSVAASTTTSTTIVQNQFSINSNELRCVSTHVTTTGGTTTTTTNTQPLVENVEDMQITYGVDANGTGSANYYVDAGSVTNWSQVISLHVSLLLVSQEDNLAPVAQTYQYNGAATTATDRRLRAVFNTTIALRNLLP